MPPSKPWAQLGPVPASDGFAAFRGDVILVENEFRANEAVSWLIEDVLNDGSKLLGFDMEWRPFDPNGHIALVQLCSRRRCALFRLNKLGGMPVSLRDLLVDNSFTKVGHSCLPGSNDYCKLLYEYGIIMGNVMDVKDMAVQMLVPSSPHHSLGLRSLCNWCLALDMDKSQTLSDWAADTLTREQILYAATDAWVTREVYFALLRYCTISVSGLFPGYAAAPTPWIPAAPLQPSTSPPASPRCSYAMASPPPMVSFMTSPGSPLAAFAGQTPVVAQPQPPLSPAFYWGPSSPPHSSFLSSWRPPASPTSSPPKRPRADFLWRPAAHAAVAHPMLPTYNTAVAAAVD